MSKPFDLVPFSQAIPKLFKANFVDIGIWHFVKGVLHVKPELGPAEAIKAFADFFGLSEDNMPHNTIYTSYYRMDKKIKPFRKELKSMLGPETEAAMELATISKTNSKFERLEEYCAGKVPKNIEAPSKCEGYINYLEGYVKRLESMVMDSEIVDELSSEQKLFLDSLMKHSGNITETSSETRITRRKVYRWLDKSPKFKMMVESIKEASQN